MAMKQEKKYNASGSVDSNRGLQVPPASSVGKKESSSTSPYPSVTCLGHVKVKLNESGVYVREEDVQKSELFLVSQKETRSKGYKKKALEQLRYMLTLGSRRHRSNCVEARPSVHPHLVLTRFSSSISAETRRDRSATLATSLICLLKNTTAPDLEYVPAIPPPNSLLLMRGVSSTKMINGVDSFEMKTEEPFHGQDEDHLQEPPDTFPDGKASDGDGKLLSAKSVTQKNNLQAAAAAADEAVSLSGWRSSVEQASPTIKVERNGTAGNVSSKSSKSAMIWERREVSQVSVIDTTNSKLQ